ncbi:hypothetical protein [Yinghuangia seranimata]|uniref:hypothetical protein n=1 Tax=Yinghuangia seranimata TaxID=408067 RepID=UPI00248D0EA8|nr:hypothetical protein [Yinghuangia seranimata]MDI2124600.1 hypothetical protein [Yinghuangia seranimata]
MSSTPPSGSAALDRLHRWEDAGGVWRLLAVTNSGASVALYRCDGGEEVERVGSADPEFLAYLADRPRSDT